VPAFARGYGAPSRGPRRSIKEYAPGRIRTCGLWLRRPNVGSVYLLHLKRLFEKAALVSSLSWCVGS
jgi:hypothetical protein